MKNIFNSVLGFAVGSLLGCSDKYSSLYEAAAQPQLLFGSDTLTIREKDYLNINQTGKSVLVLMTSSFNKQMKIEIADTSTKIHFEYRGVRFDQNQPLLVASDSSVIYCNCDTAGVYAVDFYLTDQLGKTTAKTLIVNCLANKTPKAAFSVQLKDSTLADNWSYSFDASGSVDPDGMIRSFHYLINGLAIVSVDPLISWTFHARGVQTVSMYCIDDLGKYSDTVTQKIMIP